MLSMTLGAFMVITCNVSIWGLGAIKIYTGKSGPHLTLLLFEFQPGTFSNLNRETDHEKKHNAEESTEYGNCQQYLGDKESLHHAWDDHLHIGHAKPVHVPIHHALPVLGSCSIPVILGQPVANVCGYKKENAHGDKTQAINKEKE